MKIILAAALLAGIATPATATTLVLNGDTTGQPAYNRPVNLDEISSIGLHVRYQVTEFTVGESGPYTLTLLAQSPTYDTFLALYDGTFSPSDPLVGLIDLNDDTGVLNRSEIIVNLAAGGFFQAVVSGFEDRDFGPYSLTFSGPGEIIAETVSPVPEPATWAMLLIGFGMTGTSMRYRRRRVAVAYS